MVTIITDTLEEFNNMLKEASVYVCRQLTFGECGKYPRGNCERCYWDHHIECGIRVIPPIDDNLLVDYNDVGGCLAQCKPRKGGHDSAQSQRIPTLSI